MISTLLSQNIPDSIISIKYNIDVLYDDFKFGGTYQNTVLHLLLIFKI